MARFISHSFQLANTHGASLKGVGSPVLLMARKGSDKKEKYSILQKKYSRAK